MSNTICTVATCLPDWGAVATLLTGIAAVCGAIFLGRRQLKISESQTKIAERQAELAHRALRHELFDRRMAVFEGTVAYLGFILREAAPPGDDVLGRFALAKANAAFLFRPNLVEVLNEIWSKGFEYRSLHRRMARAMDRPGPHAEGDPELESEMLRWFHETYERIIPLFNDEMGVA